MVTTEVASGGPFQNFTNIFAAPTQAFAALKHKPTALFPVVALILASCAVTLWYYSKVDAAWLIERSLDASQSQVPAEARAQLTERAAAASPYVMGGSAAVAGSLAVLIIMLVGAGYLSIVSLVTNDGYRFKNWFSLVAWSSLPALLSLLASLVNLAVSDVAHLPPEQLNPLTFANLLGLEPAAGDIGARVLQQTGPTAVWSLALMAIGYSLWTGKGRVSSALIVAGPLLVIVAVLLAL
jgi:hypothetical protein